MGNKGLRYAIRDGFVGMRRHPLIILVSVTTMLFMLILLGAFVVFAMNANYALKKAGETPPVEVQFAVGSDPDLVVRLAQQFEDNPNIVEYKVMSPEDNIEDFKQRIDKPELFDEFDYSKHIPWTILLRLKDPQLGSSFREEVLRYPGVYDVVMETALMQTLESSIRDVSLFSFVVFVVLLIITILVINNMIRMIALSRSGELYIMKTVGATDRYIRIPFIVEGLFVSLISSILAFVLVLVIYQMLLNRSGHTGIFSELLPLSSVVLPTVAAVVLFALLLGGTTSALSVKRHIRV